MNDFSMLNIYFASDLFFLNKWTKALTCSSSTVNSIFFLLNKNRRWIRLTQRTMWGVAAQSSCFLIPFLSVRLSSIPPLLFRSLVLLLSFPVWRRRSISTPHLFVWMTKTPEQLLLSSLCVLLDFLHKPTFIIKVCSTLHFSHLRKKPLRLNWVQQQTPTASDCVEFSAEVTPGVTAERQQIYMVSIELNISGCSPIGSVATAPSACHFVPSLFFV